MGGVTTQACNQDEDWRYPFRYGKAWCQDVSLRVLGLDAIHGCSFRPSLLSTVSHRKRFLDEARKKAIVTLGTATTPEEAIALDQAGVDVVVASALRRVGIAGPSGLSQRSHYHANRIVIPSGL